MVPLGLNLGQFRAYAGPFGGYVGCLLEYKTMLESNLATHLGLATRMQKKFLSLKVLSAEINILQVQSQNWMSQKSQLFEYLLLGLVLGRFGTMLGHVVGYVGLQSHKTSSRPPTVSRTASSLF